MRQRIETYAQGDGEPSARLIEVEESEVPNPGPTPGEVLADAIAAAATLAQLKDALLGKNHSARVAGQSK